MVLNNRTDYSNDLVGMHFIYLPIRNSHWGLQWFKQCDATLFQMSTMTSCKVTRSPPSLSVRSSLYCFAAKYERMAPHTQIGRKMAKQVPSRCHVPPRPKRYADYLFFFRFAREDARPITQCDVLMSDVYQKWSTWTSSSDLPAY